MFRSDVLKITEFRRLFVGQAVSQFGDALYFLLFLFMVDKITGSAAMVGYVGALEAIPFLVFGPYAGAIADRFDRKKIMLCADIASATILIALAVTILLVPKPPVAMVLAAAFLLSLVNTFFSPAKSAAVPALVPADLLMEANSLSMATQNTMPLFGLALSATVLGVLYKFYPALFFPTAALLNALTFLYSAACISLLPRLMPQRDEQKPLKKPLAEAWEGFRFIGRDHVLKVSLILGLFLNLFISPFMVAHVKANRVWFGGQFGTLASFEGSFLVAMVLTSLLVGKMKIVRPGLGFVVGLAPLGFFVAAMAYGSNYWFYLLCNVVCGLTLPFAILPMNTYQQLVVPDAYRGRVQSAQMMATRGITPISMGLAGVFLERFGLQAMFLTMGLGMGLSVVIGLFDRQFREARMPNTESPVELNKPEKMTGGEILPCEG